MLFYLPKITTLGEIGKKMQLPPLHKFKFPILKRFVDVMTNLWLYLLLFVPDNPLSQRICAN